MYSWQFFPQVIFPDTCSLFLHFTKQNFLSLISDFMSDLLYSPSVLNLWLLCSRILYVSWISQARLNLSTWIPQKFIKSTEKIRLLCYVKDIRGAPLTREVSLHRIQGHQWPVSEYPSSPPDLFISNVYVVKFFSFIFISWTLITLQYCSGFCHTLTWISHGFTCVPPPETPSHLPPHPILLDHSSTPAPSTCLMHPTWTGDLYHTW